MLANLLLQLLKLLIVRVLLGGGLFVGLAAQAVRAAEPEATAVYLERLHVHQTNFVLALVVLLLVKVIFQLLQLVGFL